MSVKRGWRWIGMVAIASLMLMACQDDSVEEGPGENQGGENGATQNNQEQGPQLCTPGATRCDGAEMVATCNEEGMQWEPEPCPEQTRCDGAANECVEQICTPGQFEGCGDDGLHEHCNATGTEIVSGECPGGESCTDEGCPTPECDPGETRCASETSYNQCSQAGVYVPSGLCVSGTECFEGQCDPLCEISRKVSSYIGCEYWSIDLDNYQEALSEPHAIVVTNPNEELFAEIELYEGASDRRILQGADGEPLSTSIAPGQARILSIPPGYGHSGTQIFEDRAMRMTASIPVVAHQFNPLNNVGVFSNDGSLLLPTNTVGTEYWAMSWMNRDDNVRLRGYVTMVNSSTSPTTVTVTPTTEVLAGPDMEAMEAGVAHDVELMPGQSLNLVSSEVDMAGAQSEGCLTDPEGQPDAVQPCPDLTGTHIVSEQPITVFGGHQCANVLLGVDRCDHIESKLLPTDTWGTNYVATKFEPRAEGSTPEPDIWRVMAAEDDTRLQTDPPIEGIHNARLDAGEWKQFPARQDFELAADKPVQMMQYMVGANWPGIPRICDEGRNAFNPTGIGDPAMATAVPVDSFRDQYIVHTPTNYEEDYLNIIVEVGQDVELNGEPIAGGAYEVVGEMNRFEVATVEVGPGFQTLTSDEPFGVIGYGYDCHVSYAYPGGLNLEEPASETPP